MLVGRCAGIDTIDLALQLGGLTEDVDDRGNMLGVPQRSQSA
jgi:hypothetical protein